MVKKELKFRAWNEKGKIFSYFTLEELGMDMGYVNMDIVMQYINFKDKNRKEIYEGDIVEWEDFEPKDSDILKNRWHNLIRQDKEDSDWGDYKIRDVVTLKTLRFWLKEESFGWEGENLISVEKCKVIGNIYEKENKE